MAVTALKIVQMAQETTSGTQRAADWVLPGTLSVTTDKPAHRPTGDRGSFAEFRRSVVTKQSSKLRYEGDALYEMITQFLGSGLKGNVTPTKAQAASNVWAAATVYSTGNFVIGLSADTGLDFEATSGGTSAGAEPTWPTAIGGTVVDNGVTWTARAQPNLWTYKPQLRAGNNPDSISFEFGDEQQEWECPYAVCESWELGITMDEVVSMRADFFAHYVSKSTFTSISDPAVTEIVANKMNVWINDTWATLGNTAKDTLVSAATIRMSTGLSPVKYADGTMNFSAVSEGRRHLEIDFDMVMNALGEAEWDAFDAQTPRAIRLKITGPVINGSFTNYLIIDAIGQYTTPPEFFTEKDGENIVRFTFASMEVVGVGGADELSISVQNNQKTYAATF